MIQIVERVAPIGKIRIRYWNIKLSTQTYRYGANFVLITTWTSE